MFVQTVLGPVMPEDLGVTMMHEHLVWDQSVYMKKEKETAPEKRFLDEPISVENSYKTRIFHLHAHKDNLIQKNVAEVIEEVSRLKKAGGSSLVDCSCYGIARDVKAEVEVAKKTGLNVIAATGFYTKGSCKEVETLSAKQKEEVFIRELEKGIDDTGVLAGIIGEIGVSGGIPECEKQTLIAAARAQERNGAPVFIHQPGIEKAGHEILRTLKENGGNLQKTVLCHCDPVCDDLEYLITLAEKGVTLSFDQFGIECVFAPEDPVNRVWLPRDIERIRAIAALCRAGFSKQIVLSQDLCFKSSYTKYGGCGYAHVVENILPIMKFEGITDKAIKEMTVENPLKILTKG